MGGVDKVDQQPHYQHTLRKSYRWYHKLALWLISQVILNAHKIYLGHTGSNIVFLDFIHNTIASLLASTPKIIIPDVQIPGDTYARLTGRHFPQVKKVTNDQPPMCQWPTTNQIMSCLQYLWTLHKQRQTTENHLHLWYVTFKARGASR